MNEQATDKATELAAKLIRNFNAPLREHLQREPLYDSRYSSLGEGTAARKLGIGVDVVAPGKRACPYHFHLAQEEMFIVLEGTGHLRVAGEMLPLVAGDVIFIPAGPEYPHQIINTSDAPMRYLSLSTQERPEVCEYPDSGKVTAFPGGGRKGLIGREATNLDYWDGEP